MNGDDLGGMMQELDELGDMIHEQQLGGGLAHRRREALPPVAVPLPQIRPEKRGMSLGAFPLGLSGQRIDGLR